MLRKCRSVALLALACGPVVRATTVTVSSTVLGATPTYLGFSQGDYTPNTNTAAWIDYSGVNAYRVWSAASVYTSDVAPYGAQVTTQNQFDARKVALRADPTSSTYTDWAGLNTKFSSTIQSGSNALNLNYALGQLSARNIHVIEQVTRSVSNEVTDWSGKWEQWQAYYAQAFYEAKNFNVAQFQIYNEPDLSSGETPADLYVRLQLASDAIHSAIADVDKLYGKSLVASVAGPTTGGSSASTFATWGKPLLAGNRTDYEGNATTYDLFNTYDVHLYSSNPASFATNVQYLKTNVPLNNASGAAMPVILTEFNWTTTASFAGSANNLNTPTVFTGLAADLIGAVSSNVDGMYGFKFSQTPYASASNGTIPQPTGFYYLDSSGTDNITGSTAAAEAYRLFTKGFKGARTRLSTSLPQTGASFTMTADVDPATNTYYTYASNAASTASAVTLDLSAWNVQPGSLVTIEEVSGRRFGEVSQILTVPANRQLTYSQPGQSVQLVTIPQVANQHIVSLPAAADGQVRYNASVSGSTSTNYAGGAVTSVARSTTGDNFATYVKFDLTGQNLPSVSRAILTLTGKNATTSDVETIEVYGILNDSWKEGSLTWSTAPDLSGSAPLMTGVGSDAFPVGHLTFDATQGTSMIDVTPFLQQFGDSLVSFALVREQQYAGEAVDGARVDLLGRSALVGSPQLMLFTSQTPEPSLTVLVFTGALLTRRRRR